MQRNLERNDQCTCNGENQHVKIPELFEFALRMNDHVCSAFEPFERFVDVWTTLPTEIRLAT